MKWVQFFRDGNAGERELLGGKGANLAEMTNLGLPVPPGATVTTDTFRAVRDNNGEPPPELWDEVQTALANIEHDLGRRFGDPRDPLLLSVRSGAAQSMPGMMETILNVGLNDETVKGLGKQSGDRFAWDAYRRLVQMFGRVVLDIDAAAFEKIVSSARKSTGVEHDHELTAEQNAEIVNEFQQLIERHGKSFPENPQEQLRQSVMAVFRSWDSPQAQAFRKSNAIPDDLGTAVTIQAMVFGNIGDDCASGVAFTRNPVTGEPGMFGEYMVNAQGEDVVAGVRTPQSISQMAEDPAFRCAWQTLQHIGAQLERHFKDTQDLEFTVERGKLWMLQTRTGKRTAKAAVRIAVDLVDEGLIDRNTAVLRVEPSQIERLLHPNIDADQNLEVIATGLPASPGAATGQVVVDPERARQLGEAGESVILVRPETSAEDFPGMQRSKGILTAQGGMTSHAAVVARGMGLPAVTGCATIEVDLDNRLFRVNGTVVHEGDSITIDGTSGEVLLGEATMTEPGLTDDAATLLSWADDMRALGVRANADAPEDATAAREFGAEGIGLCRTEHMFFGEGRIDNMRRMILSENDSDRAEALDQLQVYQTDDFAGIFRAMDGYPVTIRLLDPPLHEFLPTTDEELRDLGDTMELDIDTITAMVEAISEVNPMLGARGVRLGMLYPEITRMQARAIFAAAILVDSEKIAVEPEIMVPLVSSPAELERQHALIDEVAQQMFEESGVIIRYQVGTMIEVPRAALMANRIAKHADFFSIGTNDLTQMTFGLSRDDAGRFLPTYIEEGVLDDDPFQVIDQAGVGKLMHMAVEDGRAANPGLKVGLCGEHGGEPKSIAFCHQEGLNYVSCSPFRVPVARLAAAQAVLAQSS